MLSPVARKSLTDLTRRKLRTALVIIGITVGVAGLTAINVAAHAFTDAFAYSANETATAQVSVSVEELQQAEADDLGGLPNVQVVQVQTFYPTRWRVSAAPGHVTIGITAYHDPAHVELYPFQLTSGHLPGRGEILMESSDRLLQPFALGERVTITTADGPRELTIVGTTRTLGELSAAFSARARAYMSEDGLAAAGGPSRPNDIEVQVADHRQAHQTARQVTDTLRSKGVVVLGSSVNEHDFDPGPANGLFTIMNVLSWIALVLTAFLIINTVTTLVLEQMPVIGIMKALGAPRQTVVRGYLLTVGAYALIGTGLGLGIGFGGGYALTTYLAGIATLDIGPFTVQPVVLLISIAAGIGVPLLAAAVPVWSGTAITVREALAGYSVHASAVKRILPAVGWVPQTVWLGVRGVFRRRAQAVLTILALTFSASSFLAIQTTSYSVNYFLGQLFNQYGADMFVFTTRPQPFDKVEPQLLAVPNVTTVERFENRQVKTDWGQVLLTGVEDQPHLYKRDVVAGRWFRPGEQRVVLINEQVQQKSHLQIGDGLKMSTATKTETWEVIGVVHDLNGGLGTAGSAITSIDQLYAFLDRPAGYASGFMVGTADHGHAAVDMTANRVDDSLTNAGLAPTVTTVRQDIQRNQNQFQILYVLLYSVAAIVALVGALALLNTLTTSVLERRREIGILRSLGATGWRVASVFWVEGMALAGASWLVAVVVGIPGAYAFTLLISRVLIPIGFAFDPLALAMMLAFTFMIATLASLIPALSSSRVKVVETLRYE